MMVIKKILKEFAQQNIIDKIYNMIKDEFSLKDGKVTTTLIDLDGDPIIPDSRSGLYIQLKKNSLFAERVIGFISHSFGVSNSDAEKVYDLISFNLKKDNFVDNLPHILFEDFFLGDSGFTIDMSLYDGRIQKRLDVRKIDDFLELVSWNGLYVYDAHDNIRLNFEDNLTDEDYLFMQEELLDLIEYNRL
jgi:hypothetical protein